MDQATVRSVVYVPIAQRRKCQVAKCDHWKPRTWPGRQFWFVIHYCGQDHHVMRLFEGPGQLDFWLRRNARWRGALVQSSGKIRWKTPAAWDGKSRVTIWTPARQVWPPLPEDRRG